MLSHSTHLDWFLDSFDVTDEYAEIMPLKSEVCTSKVRIRFNKSVMVPLTYAS